MAWPTKTGVPFRALTLRRIGSLAATGAAVEVKPSPGWTERLTFGPAAVDKAEEIEHTWPPVPPPWIEVVAEAQIKAPTMIVNFSMPSPEVAAGPTPSSTENQRHGLPLPFPSVLANPGRLGPPRFNAADRKTLGIKR